jgi:hypothetical protein
MQEAARDFVAGGDRRIVVFVDDLDRCLPVNALQVLTVWLAARRAIHRAGWCRSAGVRTWKIFFM